LGRRGWRGHEGDEVEEEEEEAYLVGSTIAAAGSMARWGAGVAAREEVSKGRLDPWRGGARAQPVGRRSPERERWRLGRCVYAHPKIQTAGFKSLPFFYLLQIKNFLKTCFLLCTELIGWKANYF